jgi:hypothetical protein
MSEGLGEWDDELEGATTPTEAAEEDSDAPELFYPNVAEFVSGKLATSYRRQLNVQGGVTWCPQWWKHAEAISRLEALWRAWEFLAPGRHHRHERVVARPRRPPHVRAALNRWSVQRLHPGRRPPLQTRPSTLRRTAPRAVLIHVL